MAKMSITERGQALPCTQKNKIVRIQGNMNALWHPNDVMQSVLLPHIRFNRDKMLAKDNTPRHAARSTQVILVTNKRRHSNGLHKVWTTKSQGAHACYSSDVPLL